MKKVLIFAALSMVALSATSCEKAKDAVNVANDDSVGATGIDYQFLSKPAEVKKWFDEIVVKAGANSKVMYEVTMNVSRPALEGAIKRKGVKDFLMINIVYQDNVDKRRVQEITYNGSYNGWNPAETKEIQVFGAGKEDFKLEDELFDFGQVTAESINKVLADAMAKYKDDEKYEYQYIQGLDIKKDEISATIKGKLKSNAQEKSEYYKADLQGNLKN